MKLSWIVCSALPWVVACGSSSEPDLAERAPASPLLDRASGATPAPRPTPSSSTDTTSWQADFDSASPPAEEDGWRPLLCPGRRTTRIEVAGVFDTSDVPSPEWILWDPSRLAESGSWAAYFTVYDGGAQSEAVLAFRPEHDAPLGWSYHLVLADPPLELGSGRLEFDAEGTLLHHEVVQAVTIPGVEDWSIEMWLGTPVDEGGSGRDGMVTRAEANSLSRLSIDGKARALGVACHDATGAAPTRRAMACPAQATKRVSLRANLRANSELSSDAASFIAQVFAYDADGAAASVDLVFRKLAESAWEYRASLTGDAAARELGAGALAFNPDGTLAAHRVTAPLRLPRPDGTGGEPIELDFGVGTNDGGEGVDGLTSFEQASWVLAVKRDGHPGHPVACPAELEDGGDFSVPAPAPLPRTAGQMSSFFAVIACVDPNTPVSEIPFDLARPAQTSDYAAGADVIDAQLQVHHFDLYLRHLGRGRWSGWLTSVEQGVLHQHASFRWQLDERGSLVSVDGPTEVRLPLSSGRLGPPIRLDVSTTTRSQFVAWCPEQGVVSAGADGHLATTP